jgi:hypothetical protein
MSRAMCDPFPGHSEAAARYRQSSKIGDTDAALKSVKVHLRQPWQ